MSRQRAQRTNVGNARSLVRACPPWCVSPHGLYDGEEDWLHTSEPLPLIDGMLARICMTTDPVTEAEDGPYVLVGLTELTPSQANDVGLALQALASAAAATTRRAAL